MLCLNLSTLSALVIAIGECLYIYVCMHVFTYVCVFLIYMY